MNRATCLATRPDLAAKEAAWAVSLSCGEPARIALACAAGIWVPGQEELMAGYRDRYFAEVLPALVTRKTAWSKSRLSSLLFPVTLISEATIEAAEAAQPSDNLLRLAVADQTTIMRRRLAASWLPPAGYRLGSDCGSPNDGRTPLSKRVMARIRSPVRVRT